MNVLTICDRYNWGGASQVAKSLHEMLLFHGHSSVYLYGYDKMGMPAKTFPKEVVSANYWLGPHLNYVSYNLLGKNLFPVTDSKLDNLVNSSDLIHIHNIHDYAFNYSQLIKKVNKYNKPVVITCHDSWYITGRCSLPMDCTNWRKGCVKCEHKDYYHPSLIDRAAKERIKKLSAFRSIERLMFVSPSKWLFENVSEVYGKERSAIISNSVNTKVFCYESQTPTTTVSIKPVLLLVASDFKDGLKVDSSIIQQLIEEGVELHIAGSNSPFKGSNVVNHGRLASDKLAALMNVCNTHLFLSRIDNQPLVVLESLCAGMMQLTFRDKAITGMSIEEDCIFIDDAGGDFISTLSRNEFKEKIRPEARLRRSQKYTVAFSRDTMYLNYQRLYNLLIHS